MRLLRENGIHATLFDCAASILRHRDFDNALCFVMDIDLNGESGISVCQRLANSGVDLPVIFITGKDSDWVRSAAVAEHSCIAYLTKPFSAASLIESIGRVRAALA
jgi:FixJ family two-component response regulator